MDIFLTPILPIRELFHKL